MLIESGPLHMLQYFPAVPILMSCADCNELWTDYELPKDGASLEISHRPLELNHFRLADNLFRSPLFLFYWSYIITYELKMLM